MLYMLIPGNHASLFPLLDHVHHQDGQFPTPINRLKLSTRLGEHASLLMEVADGLPLMAESQPVTNRDAHSSGTCYQVPPVPASCSNSIRSVI